MYINFMPRLMWIWINHYGSIMWCRHVDMCIMNFVVCIHIYIYVFMSMCVCFVSYVPALSEDQRFCWELHQQGEGGADFRSVFKGSHCTWNRFQNRFTLHRFHAISLCMCVSQKVLHIHSVHRVHHYSIYILYVYIYIIYIQYVGR